jgi:hypothetical protein
MVDIVLLLLYGFLSCDILLDGDMHTVTGLFVDFPAGVFSDAQAKAGDVSDQPLRKMILEGQFNLCL